MTPVSGRVCSAFKAVGRVLEFAITCQYKYLNLLLNEWETIEIEPVVLPDLSAPLIIGLQTIGTHGLITKQLPQLCGLPSEKKRTSVSRTPEGSVAKKATVRERTAQVEDSVQEQRTPAADKVPQMLCERTRVLRKSRVGLPEALARSPLTKSPMMPKARLIVRGEREGCELCVLQVSSRDFFGKADDSEDEEIERHPINIAELLPSASGGGGAASQGDWSELLAKIAFEGHESMQDRLRALCTEYRAVFAESVRAQAAHVPPMALEIDADKLRQAGGRSRAPRPQSCLLYTSPSPRD